MKHFFGIMLLFAACGLAVAAPPSTLGYQGRLATSSGTPITADLSITFRLYDVQSGGTALWSETQPNVQVDAGSLSVELGKTVPLPALAWGKQLYLGIQVAGDTEMAPRPPITATPYALRAAGTKKNSIEVSAEGTAVENGTALLAAVSGVAGLSATNPLTIELDAGTYDLGSAMLSVPSFVTLKGQGQDASIITSANAQRTVSLASDTHAIGFTARNTGTPPTNQDGAIGIAAVADLANGIPVSNVTLQHVSGESTFARTLGSGARWGIYLCTTNSRVTDSIGKATGGDFSVGFRADCGQQQGLVIDGLIAIAGGSYTGVRGIYIAGGGPWSNIKVFADADTTEAAAAGPTVFGVRVFPNTANAGAAFLNLFVSISGNLATATPATLVEGIKVEIGADIAFKHATVNIENAKGQFISGVRVAGNDTSSNRLGVYDLDVAIRGIQDAAAGAGGIWGARLQGAAPEFTRAKFKVTCLAGGYNSCNGVVRSAPPSPPGGNMQPGGLLLDQVSVDVGHVDPADSSAQSIAFSDIATARIVNSTLRVQRSADNELVSGFIANSATADIRVSNSTMEIVDSTGANPGCVTSGAGGAMELFMNHFAGGGCNAGVTMTCAGNTKRGTGFLTNTCP